MPFWVTSAIGNCGIGASGSRELAAGPSPRCASACVEKPFGMLYIPKKRRPQIVFILKKKPAYEIADLNELGLAEAERRFHAGTMSQRRYMIYRLFWDWG